MASALARVSKEGLKICTFKHCISCTNIFFTVKAKVLFNPDQAAHQNMRILAAALVTIHLKRNPSCGQQLDKRKPSFLESSPNQLLPLSHTTNHYSSHTRPGPKPEVNIPGAFCMQEIQQQWQCKLHPQPGPEPLPWQSAAPTGVRDPPLPCRYLAAFAPGNSDGLFPLFSHLLQAGVTISPRLVLDPGKVGF